MIRPTTPRPRISSTISQCSSWLIGPQRSAVFFRVMGSAIRVGSGGSSVDAGVGRLGFVRARSPGPAVRLGRQAWQSSGRGFGRLRLVASAARARLRPRCAVSTCRRSRSARLMPNSSRLSVAVAENPAVRRNGGSGWRLTRVEGDVHAQRPRHAAQGQLAADLGMVGIDRLDRGGDEMRLGDAAASSRLRASTAVFHLSSPRSRRVSGTVHVQLRAASSRRGRTRSVPVLPETVPMRLEKPACSTANTTRVCTGSSV